MVSYFCTKKYAKQFIILLLLITNEYITISNDNRKMQYNINFPYSTKPKNWHKILITLLLYVTRMHLNCGYYVLKNRIQFNWDILKGCGIVLYRKL